MPSPVVPRGAAADPYVAGRAVHQQIEWLGGSTVSVLLDAAVTGGALAVMRSTLAAGDTAPLHVHGREDEMFLMLDGDAIVWVGEQRHEISSGGIAFLPRGMPHTYRVTSTTADMLTLCTPAGFEGFFRAAGHDKSLPKPDGWAMNPPVMAQAMADHGGQILGPPPAPTD